MPATFLVSWQAVLLSVHFDRKQFSKLVDLPLDHFFHPSPINIYILNSLTTFTFMSSEVRRPLLDLDPYGGTLTLGMFPLFLKRTSNVLAPLLSVVFLRFVRLARFTAFWRQVHVTEILKSSSSSSVANYRPISITPVLSKVFERLMTVCLGHFMPLRGVLPNTQMLTGKVWESTMRFSVHSTHC